MLKYLVYCLLLWQEMSVMSARIGAVAIDTKIPGMAAVSADKKTNELKDTELNAGQYSFRSENQVFNINAPMPSSCPLFTCTCTNNYEREKRSTDYVELNGQTALKLHLRKLQWNRARRICSEEGGHLAVPQTDLEETEMLNMMIKDSVGDAWLGVHDQFEEGDWITVLDEPLGKTGWAKWSKSFPNNPDNEKGNQNCARLVRNGGGMDDDACSHPKSFICKKSKL